TLSWLKSHLETSAPLEEIVRRLVMLGLEVESVADRAAALAPFRVAHVVSAEPHPDAERLRVCIVDTGAARVQVVCGAPNARAGMRGVFAPAGSTIPRTGLLLKESLIRGVASNGMLCSPYEMGISEDHDGIIELPPETPIGESFAKAAGLDDPILDVKVTPNRADCLGVRGLARDLAACGLGTLRPLAAEPVAGRFTSPIWVHLATLDEKACPLFLGRMIRGVTNGPSPRWLQERLAAIGLRPISALVDITNFMTFDVNRPLHVFDAGRIAGDLVLREAREGEHLKALNGRDYALDETMTVIADDAEVLSLGGVIGGESSGCTASTRTVFIEAALFDPLRTAATGRKLNLQSDARYRFERGLDPAFVAPGMEIATRLILELCGGEPSEVVVAGTAPEWLRNYRLRPGRIASLGGVEIAASETRRILERLGFAVAQRGDGDLDVVPPSWRGDVEGEADLVEEVLRIHGYETIPAIPLARETPLPRPALDAAQRRVGFVRRTLAARGLVEAVTFSFIASEAAAAFGGAKPELRLVNPISADLDAMRPSILPGLLDAARRNADRGFPDAALFEIGPQYRDDTPEGQETVAAGLRHGQSGSRLWNDPSRPVDAFMAKADALAAIAAAGGPIENVQVSADPPPWYHPGRAGSLRLGPKLLGHFGELHPAVLARFEAKGPAVAFEVVLDAVPLPRKPARARAPLKLSPFQPVERDFAFLVPAELPAETLLRAARGVDRKLVTEVRLFDVYLGAGLPPGRKSLAITVVLQPDTATLTDEQIEAFAQKLVAQVARATGGELRR
ncbi:MAG: phenylalanine--tRNA ligase subunit beta, partial [Alphaproteobacteria bacterium]|nr:phenylalanine--tRNA ligase subunit beta [Alphaproteobacteria bacterium]